MAVAAVSCVLLLVLLGSLASRAAAATIPPGRTTSSGQMTSSGGAMTSREFRTHDRSPPARPEVVPTLSQDASNAAPAQVTSSSATTSSTAMTSHDLQTLSSVLAGSNTDLTALHDLHLTDLSIPPEVITEALFSQIDLIQDLLEQCEEAARNNLNGDSSQESVDVDDDDIDDDMDNSREVALAARLLFLRGTANIRHAGSATRAQLDGGEESSPETADEEATGKGSGDEAAGVSSGLIDAGVERRRHHLRDDVIGDETEDDVFEGGDEVERGDTPSVSKINSLSSDTMETPETNQSLSTPGMTTSHAGRGGEIYSQNTPNLNENTTIALNESDNLGDVRGGNFASKTNSDLEESSGETTVASTITSGNELRPVALSQGDGDKKADVDVSAGHRRTRRSVALLKEPARITSEGDGENELISKRPGESHVQRFKRWHTIKLNSENSFYPQELAHKSPKRDTTLIALKTFPERIEPGQRLRSVLDDEQLFVTEKQYKRDVPKERSSDDKERSSDVKGFQAANLNEGRRSNPVGLQNRPSHDPKMKKAKITTAGSVNSKSSDLNKRQSNRLAARFEMDRHFAGTLAVAPKSGRLRARRSVDQETGFNPERFAPLIGHLVERLDYLKRSLAYCHVLLDSEQKN